MPAILQCDGLHYRAMDFFMSWLLHVSLKFLNMWLQRIGEDNCFNGWFRVTKYFDNNRNLGSSPGICKDFCLEILHKDNYDELTGSSIPQPFRSREAALHLKYRHVNNSITYCRWISYLTILPEVSKLHSQLLSNNPYPQNN